MTKPLPSAFLDRLSSFLPAPDFRLVLESFETERPASFRVNGLKSSVVEVETVLAEKGIRFERVPELPGAYVVPRSDEYALKGTDLFYSGKIYVQSLSSMLPPQFLDLAPGSRVLDVCAAPGSKTTQIADLLSGGGEVVALEKNQIRFDKLAYNCRLQGALSVRPVKVDALKFLSDVPEPFDAILLDAPCSAEGRIRSSDEKTFGFWSERNVMEKASIQSELALASFGALKPGGALVYATCTLAPEENEGVVSRILRIHPSAKLERISFPVPESRPGLSSFREKTFHPDIGKTLRILPSARYEGFYLAKIRKEAE